jgi:hypothetical protein
MVLLIVCTQAVQLAACCSSLRVHRAGHAFITLLLLLLLLLCLGWQAVAKVLQGH